MKSTQYSEKVLDHFRNPRNVGTLEGENVAVGRVGNPVCGDLMEVYIKVEDGRIVDAKFRTFGCGSAIATSSMTTELVKGMTLDEAMKVTRADVASELDGLPPIKMHCSNLAADALHEAIKQYREMQKRKHTEEAGSTEATEAIEIPEIENLEDYIGKGVFRSLGSPKDFEDLRALVVYTGDRSVEAAIDLATVTNRVVLITPAEQLDVDEEMAARLAEAGVKVITQGRVLSVSGEGEVEKVCVRNLDEDDEYDLYTDAVVLLTE